ncbi:MAG: hypothetical protein U0X92_16825 [Anaerolineales bacterium]
MSEATIVNPAYRIETARLVVRCYQPSDATLLADSVRESVEHLKPWMPWAHNEPEPFEYKAKRAVEFRGKFDLGQDYTYAYFQPRRNALARRDGISHAARRKTT